MAEQVTVHGAANSGEVAHRVLLFSYHIAPSAAVGAKRYSFLVPELRRFGFEVHVISADPGDGLLHNKGPVDPSLPTLSGIHRVRTAFKLPIAGDGIGIRLINSIARWACDPVDYEVPWIRPAIRAGLGAMHTAERGVVIATIPPRSAALAARRVAERLGWPLILDYRDPWSANAWRYRLRGQWSRRMARHLERACVAKSAALIMNTPEMKQQFIEHFPEVPTEKVWVIPNGLDPRECQRDVGAVDPAVLIHAGSVYNDRSIMPIVRALKVIAGRWRDLAPPRLVCFGTVCAHDRAAIAGEGLHNYVEFRPPVPRAQLLRLLAMAAGLVVVSGDDMAYSIPYKTYDYLLAGRPILAMSGNGTALQRLIKDSNLGIHVNPEDGNQVIHALERILTGSGWVRDETAVTAHSWSQLATQLAAVIRHVAAGESHTDQGRIG